MKSHAFNSKFLHWSYCSRCGLVWLKNEISRKAVLKNCDSQFDEARLSETELRKRKWTK